MPITDLSSTRPIDEQKEARSSFEAFLFQIGHPTVINLPHYTGYNWLAQVRIRGRSHSLRKVNDNWRSSNEVSVANLLLSNKATPPVPSTAVVNAETRRLGKAAQETFFALKENVIYWDGFRYVFRIRHYVFASHAHALHISMVNGCRLNKHDIGTLCAMRDFPLFGTKLELAENPIPCQEFLDHPNLTASMSIVYHTCYLHIDRNGPGLIPVYHETYDRIVTILDYAYEREAVRRRESKLLIREES